VASLVAMVSESMPTSNYEWFSLLLAIAGLVLGVVGVAFSWFGWREAGRARQEATGAKEAADRAVARVTRIGGVVTLAQVIEMLDTLRVASVQGASTDYLLGRLIDARKMLIQVRQQLNLSGAPATRVQKLVSTLRNLEGILTGPAADGGPSINVAMLALTPDLDELVHHLQTAATQEGG